jgi:hypothetical protein
LVRRFNGRLVRFHFWFGWVASEPNLANAVPVVSN